MTGFHKSADLCFSDLIANACRQAGRGRLFAALQLDCGDAIFEFHFTVASIDGLIVQSYCEFELLIDIGCRVRDQFLR